MIRFILALICSINLQAEIIKEYYPNGKIHFEKSYNNGVLEGIAKEYDEYECLSRITPYSNGKIHGVQIIYDMCELKPIKEISYKNGVLNGKEKLRGCYEGNLDLVRSYKNGKKHGIEIISNNDTNMSVTMYQNGVKHGLQKLYFYDRRIDTLFYNGRIQKEPLYFDNNGKLIETVLYEGNASIDKKEYDTSSTPVPSLGCSPFFDKNIDVLEESIKVEIDQNSTSAIFRNSYKISLSDGKSSIPFMLAYLKPDKYTVRIDGKAVYGEIIPYYIIPEEERFKQFSHYPFSQDSFVVFAGKERNELDSFLDNLLVFSVGLDKGEHTIEIIYRAYPNVRGGGWMDSYQYDYSMIPAKKWKSFYQFKLNVVSEDANRSAKHDISSFIQNVIPPNDFRINVEPIISQHSEELISTGADGYSKKTALFLFIFHVILLKLIPAMRYHVMMIGTTLLTTYLIIKSYFHAIETIDTSLGEFAQNGHGYIELVWLSYPFIFIIYLIALYIARMFFQKNLPKDEPKD